MQSFPSSPGGDVIPGTLQMLILHTLSRGPMHGYAIAQHIKRTSEDQLQVEEDLYIQLCNEFC